MNAKKQLGQFFTTNSDYVMQGFENYIKDKDVTDPFAGSQDLMDWAKKHGAKSVIGFDCDKRYVDNENVFLNDSINNPRKYKFICTNPPYLHKNKADKRIKELFFSNGLSIFEDLYQVSLSSLLNSYEGIVIIPLNFLCAENSAKIRELFFDKFEIVKLNIFSEQVFDDTTYNVISFYYRRKEKMKNKDIIKVCIFPENKKINLETEKKYNWQFGGEFISRIKMVKNDLGVFRLTEDFLDSGEYEVELALQNIKDKKLFKISNNIVKLLESNILYLRAIDSKNGKKIQLEDIRKYGIKGLVGKSTSRNSAHIIFKRRLSIREQENLMKSFNEELNKNRILYSSFFLTNFRDNNRKRISFDFAYKLLNYLYIQQNTVQPSLF